MVAYLSFVTAHGGHGWRAWSGGTQLGRAGGFGRRTRQGTRLLKAREPRRGIGAGTPPSRAGRAQCAAPPAEVIGERRSRCVAQRADYLSGESDEGPLGETGCPATTLPLVRRHVNEVRALTRGALRRRAELTGVVRCGGRGFLPCGPPRTRCCARSRASARLRERSGSQRRNQETPWWSPETSSRSRGAALLEIRRARASLRSCES